MKRLYLADRLKVIVSILVLLNLASVFSSWLEDAYSHWHWLIPIAAIVVSVLLIRGFQLPIYVMKQTENVLDEMIQGQYTSRITQVPWMGEAGHIAWNLNESLDQLETFFREVRTSFELV